MKRGRRVVELLGGESGAAIIEFALVTPLLLLLVFGIIESGRAIYTVNALASAVRDGARYGATCDLGAYGQTPVMSTACRTGIESIVVGAFQPLGKPLTTPFPPECCEVDIVVGSHGIRVEVSYDYDPITPISSWDLFITRSAVFRYERAP